MRIWKRAAWRKKLLKSSSEFSAIQEDSLLRLGILFLSCLCDCWAGVSPLRRRPKGFPIALWKPSAPPLLGFLMLDLSVTIRNVDSVAILWINTRA